MPYIVLIAEGATLLCFVAFFAMLAGGGANGPIFAIKTSDPVARTLIRSAQVAFVLGYGFLFAYTAAVMADLV
ncbi:MAG: hypothetical protein MRY74_17230 [Neomegalonema sp.]|nr:hypothetical protein [Neomegalonema sp.]